MLVVPAQWFNICKSISAFQFLGRQAWLRSTNFLFWNGRTLIVVEGGIDNFIRLQAKSEVASTCADAHLSSTKLGSDWRVREKHFVADLGELSTRGTKLSKVHLSQHCSIFREQSATSKTSVGSIPTSIQMGGGAPKSPSVGKMSPRLYLVLMGVNADTLPFQMTSTHQKLIHLTILARYMPQEWPVMVLSQRW